MRGSQVGPTPWHPHPNLKGLNPRTLRLSWRAQEAPALTEPKGSLQLFGDLVRGSGFGVRILGYLYNNVLIDLWSICPVTAHPRPACILYECILAPVGSGSY